MKKFFGELKRYDNPMFWITGISQLLIVIQVVLAIFGKETLLDQALQNKIMQAVNVIIAFLGTIGVFTKGAPSMPVEPITPVEPVVPSVEPVAPSEPVVAPVEPSAPSAPVSSAVESVSSDAPVEPAEETPTVIQGPTVVIDPNVTPGPVEETK